MHPDGRREFALEGAVFVTGSGDPAAADGLQIIDSAGESGDLAPQRSRQRRGWCRSGADRPGGPDWDPYARGTIPGHHQGTTRAHLVRATLEAIAYEVRDVVDVMTQESSETAEFGGRWRRLG